MQKNKLTGDVLTNEALNVLHRHLSGIDDNKVYYFGNDKVLRWFGNMYSCGASIPRDAPDLVIKKDNDVLLVEHFEFDSFSSSKKGSQNKIEQSRIKRYQESLIPTEEGVSFVEQICGESTYNNFYKNAISIFDKHYKNIKQYKENVIQDGIADSKQSMKTMFLIDDASPLGSIAEDNDGGCYHVTLARCKPFLEHLIHAKDLDYILCTSYADNQNIIWFIDLASLSEYQANALDYESMQFLGFQPKVFGCKIEIHDK